MTPLAPPKQYCLAPEENPEPNSAGLENSRTRGARRKPPEENHSAQIKVRSLIGNTMCSEKPPKRF